MICADGTTVGRVYPSCEFDICKDSISPIITQQLESKPIDEASLLEQVATKTPKEILPKKERVPLSVAPPKDNTLITVIEKTLGSFVSLFSQNNTPSSSTNNQTVPNSNNTPTKTYNDERYSVNNGTIIDSNGNAVAALPPSSYTSTSSGSSWETHTVNAISVGSTTPVVDGVPVEGQVGKYYISENSFGNRELCEFSNRIYIFDSITNDKVLLYEENTSTLSQDDERACNSEIFLLATEEQKLIFKYHTINTNMICESTWSAPHNTWYLNVTTITSSSRYPISNERYEDAETKELVCRSNLETQ
ncbi:MAG: hypothetical protein RI935_485 [Candidatus Parcubacteria bacterium]